MTVLTVLAGAVLVRQCFVLAAVIRSARFLRTGRSTTPPATSDGSGRTFFLVVVPVLRETTVVGDAIRHLQAVAAEHVAQLIVVTTAREHAKEGATTADVVAALAGAGKVIHLHHHDHTAIKADQVNYAAEYCAVTLLGDVAAKDAFVVVYDADSRPPLDSLAAFERASMLTLA